LRRPQTSYAPVLPPVGAGPVDGVAGVVNVGAPVEGGGVGEDWHAARPRMAARASATADAMPAPDRLVACPCQRIRNDPTSERQP
jgi:hypothetical protein